MVEKIKYLAGRKVLVVEDEFFLADELSELLQDAGADVLGPVSTAGNALEVLASGQKPDFAILDIDLQGDDAYSVCDALTARRIPFVFVTGFNAEAIIPQFRHIVRLEKPFKTSALHDVLRKQLTAP